MSGALSHGPKTPAGRQALAGSCHGFNVRSTIPLELTREPLTGDGADELVVRPLASHLDEPTGAPVQVWQAKPGKPFSARLHRTPDGFGMWIDGLGSYIIDPHKAVISVPCDRSPSQVETRLWGIPAVLCFLARGDVSLHAAAIEIDGRAVLLTGPGRHGKTTLAAAFHRAGFRVLSEDLCRIRIGSAPEVFPAAAMLRLRHDVRVGLGELTNTKVVSEDDDRVHLAVTDRQRGSGVPVPIGGVVMLRVGDGERTLRTAPTLEAIRDLWGLSYNLPTDPDRARCFDGVAALAATVPVWNLTRPLTFRTLDDVVQEIAARCVS